MIDQHSEGWHSDPDYDRGGNLIGAEPVEAEYDPYQDEDFGHRGGEE